MAIATNSMFSTGAAFTRADQLFELHDFTASCEDAQVAITATFAARTDLCRRLVEQIRTLTRREPRMAERRRAHLALVAIILDARDDFPPQEFILYTDLEDGTPAIDTIACADKIRAARLLAELMETPAEAAERRTMREARADVFTARAHGQIVEALLLGRG